MSPVTKLISALSIVLLLTSCTSESTETISSDRANDSTTTAPAIPQHSHVSMVEIPAVDIDRAVQFYTDIMAIEIEKMDMPGMQMGILPYDNELIPVVIMQAEGYIPSASGVTVYLNAGDQLDTILGRVESAGGQIILPKTAHADGSGYFATFIDTEGNKLGLNMAN